MLFMEYCYGSGNKAIRAEKKAINRNPQMTNFDNPLNVYTFHQAKAIWWFQFFRC